MCATHLLIMLYLSVKFHRICFSSLSDIAETRFVTDGRTDGAILICHPKFLRGHKKTKSVKANIMNISTKSQSLEHMVSEKIIFLRVFFF